MREQFLAAIAKSFKRVLRVRHVTRYQYDRPIERSELRMILQPMHDSRQQVITSSLKLDPVVPLVEYEDVFGNHAVRATMQQPYTELTIAAESDVALSDIDPFAFANSPIRPTFPLVWMPWERTMLEPYLTCVELPETQIKEIYDFAMSFAEANNHDLMETLFAINLTLFRDFAYVPGSTHLETTPFEVLMTKKGVCQDFANLFIAMARLLNIPARYVCGYIHTGNTGENRAQSDASHAWVQLYIPKVGWKGFDPTNGVLTHTAHVRVGYGRHFRDCTPTAGTLYTAATETMSIDVEVIDLTETVQKSDAPAPVDGSVPSVPSTDDPTEPPKDVAAVPAGVAG